MTHQITRMNPASLPDAAALGYAQISVVEPGRMAYVSGQVAVSADGAPVPEDVVDQTRIATANAGRALEVLGAEPKDIAILRCYMTDLTPETLERAMPVLMEFLGGELVSITGVGVAALASPEFKVEIEMTVRLPD